MTVAHVAKKVQLRKTPCDKFYTPVDVCKKAIEMVENKPEYVWFDPWKGSGNFYNNFPEGNEKHWCEIEEGKDFFDFEGKVDVVASNPPFSKIEKCLNKLVELDPKHIVLILGCLNLTMKRIDILKNYEIKHLTIFKVRYWFGNTYIVHFEKVDKPVMSHNTTVSIIRKEFPFQNIEPKEEESEEEKSTDNSTDVKA